VFGLAKEARLPSVGPLRCYAHGGALASYGSNFVDLFQKAAPYVDRVLRGGARAYAMRARNQPKDRGGDRPHGALVAVDPRRRGHRIA
jgi:hypothetical protein